MTSAEQLTQFREVLLQHARSPRNHGLISEGLTIGECKNPLCGDLVRVGIQNENSVLKVIRIEVQGCAMATASASLLSESLRGLSYRKANELRKLFESALLETPEKNWPEALQNFMPLSHLRINRARIPCALMGWYALKEAITKSVAVPAAASVSVPKP